MGRDIEWGPKRLKRAQGTEHFLLVGASGSGKTTLMKTMMRSIFDSNYEFTGLVYDPKQELLPALFALRGDLAEHVRDGTSSIRVLNPFDERCCTWDLAKDIDGPVSARQFASILVSETKGAGSNEQFFINAVRDILTGLMLVFINCAAKDANWTFRDLLLGALYPPYLKVLLEQSTTRDNKPFPIVHRLKATYLNDRGDSKTLANILATMSAKLSVYEPVAAAWYKAQTKGKHFTFSLREWARGDYTDILVLGNEEAGRSSIDPINQAIFKRATELLLARPETSSEQKRTGEKQTWFFLDEVREAGYLDGLSSLLTKGRSKGACVVLAFQDIEGLRDVYGAEIANELCGQCNNTVVLRLNSPATAQWACELFGKRIDLAATAGTQGTGLSQNTSFQEQERPFYYTSDFTYLPSANPENGITGYARNPEVNPDTEPARWTLSPWDIDEFRPKEPKRSDQQTPNGHNAPDWFAASMPMSPKTLYLEPWTEKDWKRLGFAWPFNAIATSSEEAKALGLPARFPAEQRKPNGPPNITRDPLTNQGKQ